MSAAGAILVISEIERGAVTRLARELLGLALGLKAQAGYAVNAAVFAPKGGAVAEELIALGAEQVYCVEHPGLVGYHSEAWTSAAAQLCEEASPELVLTGHTATGADLAPRLAFRMQDSVATGCVDISWRDGACHFTRPCYGGNVRETLSFTSGLCVATVRAGCSPASVPEAARRGEVRRFQPVLDQALKRMRVVARRADAVVMVEDAFLNVNAGRLGALATAKHLPSIGLDAVAQGGGLLAYGVNQLDMFQRAATYIDKIFKGARPADLPIQRSSTFDLILNLKTARQLGVRDAERAGDQARGAPIGIAEVLDRAALGHVGIVERLRHVVHRGHGYFSSQFLQPVCSAGF